MDSSIFGIARRPRVKRDTKELHALSGGDPQVAIEITIRRLGHGGIGRPEELFSAAMAVNHPDLVQRGKRS